MFAELFPEINAIFEDGNAPIHMDKVVTEWRKEHSNKHII